MSGIRDVWLSKDILVSLNLKVLSSMQISIPRDIKFSNIRLSFDFHPSKQACKIYDRSLLCNTLGRS